MRFRTPAQTARRRSRKPFRTLLLLLLASVVSITIAFWDHIVIVIEPGEGGVLWNRFTGTQIDRVYHERVHIISPLDRMYKYEMRKQIAVHTLDVLSIEGLTLTLHLALRFRPRQDMLGVLHNEIGPDYLNSVVIPQTESVLRKELSIATAEEIYTNQNGLITTAILRSMEEAARNFVEIEDVIIRSIDLPPTVRAAIQEKLRERELLESYVFRRAIAVKEAERRAIEAAGLRDYYVTIDGGINERLLAHQTIEATIAIAESENPKTLVVGSTNEFSLPVFLPELEDATAPVASTNAPRKLPSPP